MIILLFIILKLTNTIFLSWWFIIVALILDSYIAKSLRSSEEKVEELEDRINDLEQKNDELFGGDYEDSYYEENKL